MRTLLGLSQREAGRILGGGPNAFYRYESGRARPSHTMVNLLRLLVADPRRLAEIHTQTPPDAGFTLP